MNKRSLALAALLVASACSQVGSRHTAGSELIFTGLAGEPDTLNPMLSDEADELNFSHLYMSYLIENDDRGDAVAEVAREVPTRENGGISEDQRTITYQLRHDVRWQDGKPLTARDVVFSYRAIMNPHNNVALRVGYEEVQSIRAAGRYTVVVRLRRRFAPFIQYFFGPQGVGAIMPAHLLAGLPDLNHAAYNQRPIGSGPFRVMQWRRGDAIVLAANPYYWRGKPRIDRLIYRIIPDPSTRLEQLRTGESDAYFDVDPQLLPQVRAIPGIRLSLTPVADLHVLRFNLRDPLMRDAAIRRAIAMAIDRRTLIAAATHGSGIAVSADQGIDSWAYDSRVPSVRYDPAEAKRLLDGRAPEVTLTISPQIINGSQLVATIIQEDLRRIGIHVIIKQVPSAMLYASAAQGGIFAGGKYQLAYDAWWVLGSDPDDSWNFGCDQLPPHGINYSFWCDARADAAMRDALGTVDRTRRKADYAIVARAIAAELPVFTLWQVRVPDAFRSYVRAIAPAPGGSTFWNAWRWYIGA